MKPTVRLFLVLGLLCLLLPGAGFSQTAQATLTGRVLDSSNAAVPRVTVDVVNVATNQSVRIVTDV